MKTILTTIAAIMLLAACDAPESGCAECEKMARQAQAEHQAKIAAEKGEDCECCKGKKHAH